MVVLKIKELAKNNNLSLLELSAKVGISKTSLSQIVTGKQKPSLDTLEKIASALNVGISDLFGDSVASDANTLRCPHCGKPIRVSVE